MALLDNISKISSEAMENSRVTSHASSSERTVGPAGELAKVKHTPESGTIADHCRDVRESLVTLTQGEDTRGVQPLLPDLEDILDRFTLWTGNMGAWHPPHSRMSLDSRLSESPEVRHQISQLLHNLYESIQDGKSTSNFQGSSSNIPLINNSENGPGLFRGRQ